MEELRARIAELEERVKWLEAKFHRPPAPAKEEGKANGKKA